MPRAGRCPHHSRPATTTPRLADLRRRRRGLLWFLSQIRTAHRRLPIPHTKILSQSGGIEGKPRPCAVRPPAGGRDLNARASQSVFHRFVQVEVKHPKIRPAGPHPQRQIHRTVGQGNDQNLRRRVLVDTRNRRTPNPTAPPRRQIGTIGDPHRHIEAAPGMARVINNIAAENGRVGHADITVIGVVSSVMNRPSSTFVPATPPASI